MIGIEIIDEELSKSEAEELVDNMINVCDGCGEFHIHLHVKDYVTDYSLRWR